MAAVHPFRHSLVVRIGHQQRQAEAAQQAFGGAFPIALVVAHLDQLARERHVVFVQIQGRAQRGADLNLLIIDVAAAALQAVELDGKGLMRLAIFTECEVVLAFLVFECGGLRLERVGMPG